MDERRIDLARYRLDKASKCIGTAKENVILNDYESAANRSYYAMFHTVRAILALEGVDFKSHMQVIGYFRKQYIKSGVFGTEYSDYLGDAFNIRGKSDYEDYYVISKKDVEQQIRNAERFYEVASEYLKSRIDV